MCLAGMRPAGDLDLGTPPGALDQRRADRPFQSRPSVCYGHHWMVHEGEWQIVRADDGRMLTIPPITPYQRLARGPD